MPVNQIGSGPRRTKTVSKGKESIACWAARVGKATASGIPVSQMCNRGGDRHSVASSGFCRRGTLASIQFFRTTLGRLIVILN